MVREISLENEVFFRSRKFSQRFFYFESVKFAKVEKVEEYKYFLKSDVLWQCINL